MIPRFDYREQYRAMKSEIFRAIEDVLESGLLILGPRVAAFEESICRFLGAPGFAVGVGNGTDAIAIALKAMNIGAGDEVITVANTAIGTVSAIRMANAKPVFCEIDPDTLLMDPHDVETRITKRTKAIIPVHLFGNAADMMAINAIARRNGLRVIEDCAQSLGTTLAGQHTGTFGHVGCFSFYPTKNLGAYGDAGLCYTKDPRLALEMRRIRSYGSDGQSSALREGVNSRLDEMQAAVLEIKLRYLQRFLEQRRAIAQVYLKNLPRGCSIPHTMPTAEHTHHLFVIRSSHRDDLIESLRSAGIQSGVHYATPIHLMPAYRFLGYGAGSFPTTEEAATQVLSLPCYPELELESVNKVCRVVSEFMRASHRRPRVTNRSASK